jgi:Sugar (and other) transporter
MIATYAWLAGGELPAQRLCSYTFGFTAAVSFFGAWLTTFNAPYFINSQSLDWGPKYGYIWCPSCAIAALWIYFFLPEVKNRTLEQITVMVRHLQVFDKQGVCSRFDCPSLRLDSLLANSEHLNVLAQPL